jgi:hypothetical protein
MVKAEIYLVQALLEVDYPDFFVGRSGRRVRGDFERASNILLKLRSGAAVTEPEMNRFLKEMRGWYFNR